MTLIEKLPNEMWLAIHKLCLDPEGRRRIEAMFFGGKLIRYDVTVPSLVRHHLLDQCRLGLNTSIDDSDVGGPHRWEVRLPRAKLTYCVLTCWVRQPIDSWVVFEADEDHPWFGTPAGREVCDVMTGLIRTFKMGEEASRRFFNGEVITHRLENPFSCDCLCATKPEYVNKNPPPKPSSKTYVFYRNSEQHDRRTFPLEQPNAFDILAISVNYF